MKTNLNEQLSSEYRSYLRTKAMVDYYKPLFRDWAKEHKDLKDWTVTFGSDQRVLVMFYSTNNTEPKLSDFVRIRETLANDFSYGDEPVDFKTKVEGFLGEGSEYIGAKAFLPSIGWKYGKLRPTIEIRMFGIDKCEIEYVEKTVKEPVLTGFCAEVVNQ